MESEEAKKELEKGKQVQRRKVWSNGTLGRQQLGTASLQSSVLAALHVHVPHIGHIAVCIGL